MNKLEVINNLNEKYVSLSEEEQMKIEGGSITLTTGAIIGIGLAVTGLWT